MELPNLYDPLEVNIPKSPAERTNYTIRKNIKAFINKIDPEHELHLHLNFPDFYSTWFMPLEPDLMLFGCVNDNMEEVRIIQHCSQINISLTIVKKNPDKKGFGFTLDNDKKEDIKE